MDLHRIDPKHYRWYQEIIQGGSLLLHRPGASTLHKGPDGLSRNVEGRDHLILAKDADWIKYRDRIKGICEKIHAGEAYDDEAEATTVGQIDKSNPEALKPLPYDQGLAVSLKYEKGSQDRKFKPTPRGEVAVKAAASASAASSSVTPVHANNPKQKVKFGETVEYPVEEVKNVHESKVRNPIQPRTHDPDDDRCRAHTNLVECELEPDCQWNDRERDCEHNPWRHLQEVGRYATDPLQVSPIPVIPTSKAKVLDEVAKILERRERIAGITPAVMPKTSVKALFVGPFVLDKVLREKRDYWEERLSKEYDVKVSLEAAEPPFTTDDIDCKGYWLKPDALKYEQRVKKLKSQVSSALITLMTEVDRVRPRILIGEGQGGVVVAMSSFPIITERACRDRAVTQHQMDCFRRAWSGVTSLLVIDPAILPTSNNQRTIPFDLLKDAFPNMSWKQPRGNRRRMLITPKYMAPPFAE